MWNGDLRIADEIIAPRFKAHLSADAGLALVEAKDPAGVANWVAQTRSRSRQLTYHVTLGPMVDNDKVVAYWQAVGCAKTPGGDGLEPFTRVGVDILRFNRERVEECWSLSNPALVASRRWGY